MVVNSQFDRAALFGNLDANIKLIEEHFGVETVSYTHLIKGCVYNKKFFDADSRFSREKRCENDSYSIQYSKLYLPFGLAGEISACSGCRYNRSGGQAGCKELRERLPPGNNRHEGNDTLACI